MRNEVWARVWSNQTQSYAAIEQTLTQSVICDHPMNLWEQNKGREKEDNTE